MNIPFTKMHGLGNDFVLIEEDQLTPDIDLGKLALTLCDRHFGVGADGLVVVAPPEDPTCDIQFKFFNNDGSVAEMCGNGIRCFARYVKDQGLIKRHEFRVQTGAGVLVPHLNPDGTVTVDMGQPFLEPSTIPFSGVTQGPVTQFELPLDASHSASIAAVGMGNPHCILYREEQPQDIDWQVWGPQIERHPLFPAKTNVEFVEVLDKHTVSVDVWERGVGPTLACGTGACAVAVAGILKGLVQSPVKVNLPGGSLTIQWDGQGSVMMTGPAVYVFAGMFPLAVATSV